MPLQKEFKLQVSKTDHSSHSLNIRPYIRIAQNLPAMKSNYFTEFN